MLLANVDVLIVTDAMAENNCAAVTDCVGEVLSKMTGPDSES